MNVRGGLIKLLAGIIFCYSLFSFKFEILGELRIDDFFVISLWLISVCFFSKRKNLFIKLIKQDAVKVFLFFILINIFSVICNTIENRIQFVQGALYALRHFEYFSYFFLGYILSYYGFNYGKLFNNYFIFVLILIPLQYFGLFPVFSGFSPDRAIANTGGPWELAVLAGFLVVYFYKSGKLYFASGAFLLVLATGSRITLFSVLLLCFFKGIKFLREIKKNSVIYVILLGHATLFLIFVIYNSDLAVANRAKIFFSEQTLDVVLGFFENQIGVISAQEFSDLSISEKLNFDLSSAEGDQSAFVRFSNWIILIKSLLIVPAAIFIGLGPSFAGKAVDGAYVRLMVEVGFLGLSTYLIFLYKIIKSKPSGLLGEYILIVAVSAIFIDVFTTYKIMLIFWVTYGAAMHKNNFKKI